MSKNVRVVIADDNRNFCSILKEVIDREEGFEVVGVAHDGITALELTEKNRPELVILDIIMPLLDGLGVLEKVKISNNPNKPKFIVMSAVGHDDITFRAVNLGASYYVVKPFDMVEFVRRMKQFLNGAQPDPMNYQKNIAPNTDELVMKQMRDFGVPMHVKGYQYIYDSVKLVINDPALLDRVTKKIYPKIAEAYDTTDSRVERSIRNAIELTFARGNKNILDKSFGSFESVGKKVSNSEFISSIVERVRSQIK